MAECAIRILHIVLSCEQLVSIALLTKVHTAHTLQINPCTLKTAFLLALQNCQFIFSNHEKDLI